MSIVRTASAYIASAAITLGVAASSTVAGAADMPVKAAPKLTSPWVLDVHGYADLTFANTRVTNGGLLLYRRGFVTQVDTGLSLDIYKDPNTFINSFSVFGGIWNEVWSSPPIGGRTWQEMDWWVGATVGFANYWSFTAQHVQFMFPGGGTVYNYDFKLALNDSFTGLPITFNPYVDVFYNAAGGSTVVLGKTAGSSRVSLGMAPTFSLLPSTGVPLTISVPTWITFGPSEFWNRNDGTTNFCGATTTAPCALSNLGYVTTGVKGVLALDSLIPKRLGNWYLKGGVQWYHLDNDALLGAQTPVGTNVSLSYPDAKRDIAVVYGGVGFTF